LLILESRGISTSWHHWCHLEFVAHIVKCWILPFHEVCDCGHSLVNLVLYLLLLNFLHLDEYSHVLMSQRMASFPTFHHYDGGNDSPSLHTIVLPSSMCCLHIILSNLPCLFLSILESTLSPLDSICIVYFALVHSL